MSGTELFEQGGELKFGQVREDALVDIFLVGKLTAPKRLFVIASGGCTALSLLSASQCRVDALDISRAQIALVETKVAIFKHLSPEAALRACSLDGSEALAAVSPQLSAQTREIMQTLYLKNGLNNCGSVDRRMRQLAGLFYMFIHDRAHTRQFLTLTDPGKQQQLFAERWCNMQWRLAMKVAFTKSILFVTHGPSARSLVPVDFSAVMEKRLTRALTRFPNAYNPYLWQAFYGQYNDCQECLPPYLQSVNHQIIKSNIENLHLHCADSLEWLSRQADASFDYIGLSNVLELLPADYGKKIQAEVVRCTRPGAIICLRAIFPRKNPTFEESAAIGADSELTRQCQEMDRSLFCNFYEVYRRL